MRAMKRERGVSLIAGLTMLAALSLLGVGAMMSNSLETRMVDNSRDRAWAFQAAESALRDGEADVLRNLSAASAFAVDCAGGLCLPAITGAPVWSAIDWGSSTVTRTFGSRTGAAALTGVAQQPRYIIERLVSLPPGGGESMTVGFRGSSGGTAYRVTALGYGARADTRAMVQAVVVKRE